MRKLLTAAVGVAAAGGLLVAVPAPASAATVCTAAGARYICEYGGPAQRTHTFANGTQQQFVIGTDWGVWTRWTNTGGVWTTWRDHGGQIAHTENPSHFQLINCYGQPAVRMVGLDGYWWRRLRHSTGQWSGWSNNYGPLVCPV